MNKTTFKLIRATIRLERQLYITENKDFIRELLNTEPLKTLAEYNAALRNMIINNRGFKTAY